MADDAMGVGKGENKKGVDSQLKVAEMIRVHEGFCERWLQIRGTPVLKWPTVRHMECLIHLLQL